jgi:hypothetical protein
MGTLQGLLNLLTQLDELLQVFGALAMLLAVVLLAVYWYTRERTLVIEVAGDDDIHVPRPSDATDQSTRLEQAVRPELSASDEGREQEIPRDPLQES